MSQQLVRLDKQTEGIRKIVDILRMVARTGHYKQIFDGWTCGRLPSGKQTACAVYAISLVRDCHGDGKRLSDLAKDLGVPIEILHQTINYNDCHHMTYSQIADRLEYEYLR